MTLPAKCLSIAWAVLICGDALAWRRPLREDSGVVKNAELIVIAHVKPSSISYLPLSADGTRDARVNLVVVEVLKGRSAEKEISALIHHGLTPVVGGYLKCDGLLIDRRTSRPHYPKEVVEIFDTGDSRSSFAPVVDDIRDDHIWLLRRQPLINGEVGRELGIREPDEIRPASLKKYFLAHLSQEPEKNMRALANTQGEAARMAECYLDLKEVRRLAKLPDSTQREERLGDYAKKAKERMSVSDPGYQWQFLEWEATKNRRK